MKNIFRIIIVTFSLLFLFVLSGCYCDEIEENKCRVIFKDYDGTVLREEVVEKGHKATPYDNPNRYGYIFTGWDKEVTNIETDTIFVAQYNRDYNVQLEYKVVFKDNENNILKEQIVKEGEDAIAPEAPHKSLLQFFGWDKIYTNVKSDLEVIALYEDIHLEMEFGLKKQIQTLTFGRYPQSLVTDETIINALSQIAEENEFGYIEYEGNEYKKIEASIYNDKINYKFDNGETITKGYTYYFLVEPIKWNVLEEEDGVFTIISDVILENINYFPDFGYRIIDGIYIHENNYKYSEIRAWLNGYDANSYIYLNDDYTNKGFLNVAFTDLERTIIETTYVDNDSSDHNYNDMFDTTDKVYILSKEELLYYNSIYANEHIINPMKAKTTDYIRCKGAEMFFEDFVYGNGRWYLRGPSNMDWEDYAVDIATEYGTAGSAYISHTRDGIRPVLRITLPLNYDVIFKDYDGTILKEENVPYNGSVTAPEPPVRDGYEFIGWDNDFDRIFGDLEVTAKYAKLMDCEINLSIYEENGYTYINFGRYPQSVVDNKELINILDSISTTNKLGYIEYNGKEYKKITANLYHESKYDTEYEYYKRVYPYYVFNNWEKINNYETYYFEVEPIKWRVLEEENGSYKLLSEMILDSTIFHRYWYERYIDGETIYANNYQYSDIRAWLNGYDGSSYSVSNYTGNGFIDIAFTEEEQSLIATSLIDNSKSTFGNFTYQYESKNTLDKLYLLSNADINNKDYGFNSDDSKKAIVSEYARTKGCYMNIDNSFFNGNWWIRTPGNKDYQSYAVSSLGNYPIQQYAYTWETGVRPALTLNIKESNKYNVIFKDYNENVLKVDYVEHGKDAIPPVNPSRDGYDFIEWDKDFTNVQSDLVITAKYAFTEYTITFDSNGGNNFSDVTYTIYDSPLELPTPTRTGYKFIGWYENEVWLSHIEYKNYNLVAKWESLEYKPYEENGYTYINFGSYPQTVVSDIDLILQLNKITQKDSFGYIEFNGRKFTMLQAETYDVNYQFMNGDTIIDGEMYYFEIEPIKWRVIENYNGCGAYKVLSEIIIDNIAFYEEDQYSRYVDGNYIDDSDYKYSTIRAWLNGYNGSSYRVENYTNKGFINLAFTTNEKQLINETLIDDVYDKLYLLSNEDIIKGEYGFNGSVDELDENRESQVSDYSRAKKCLISTSKYYYGNGMSWLRAVNGSNWDIWALDLDGTMRSVYHSESYIGVRPALTITIL